MISKYVVGDMIFGDHGESFWQNKESTEPNRVVGSASGAGPEGRGRSKTDKGIGLRERLEGPNRAGLGVDWKGLG